jgi:S1-C subfamily serine protease
MEMIVRFGLLLVIAGFCESCAPVPAPDKAPANGTTRRMLADRASAVVVTDRQNLNSWIDRDFAASESPNDAEGGSAAPITADGYFLTADHVLSDLPHRNVFVIYGQGGRLAPAKARVVWRSKAGDIALLHVPVKTPYFYQWTPADQWIPAGTPLVHGGIATGFKSGQGTLSTSIPPESIFVRSRNFKMDLQLQPGDSGGPIVDSQGKLVGINSAVEFLVPMETAFFIDSEGSRPNTRALNKIIKSDRAHNIHRKTP